MNDEDLLERIASGALPLDEAEKRVDAVIDEGGSLETLGLEPFEVTAYVQGAPLEVLAMLRRRGWPENCGRCGTPLLGPKGTWYEDTHDGEPHINHVRCPEPSSPELRAQVDDAVSRARSELVSVDCRALLNDAQEVERGAGEAIVIWRSVTKTVRHDYLVHCVHRAIIPLCLAATAPCSSDEELRSTISEILAARLLQRLMGDRLQPQRPNRVRRTSHAG